MRSKEIFEKLNKPNNGTRTLFESIAVPEVEMALKDWIKTTRFTTNKQGVLIGGTALGYYTRPRATMDVDLLFLTKSDIPDQVTGFKRTRPGAFQHNETHVEVEVVTPQSINNPVDLCRKIISTAIESNGILVASPTGLVASKLFRLKKNDIGDIVALYQLGSVNLTGWPIPEDKMQEFNFIISKYA